VMLCWCQEGEQWYDRTAVAAVLWLLPSIVCTFLVIAFCHQKNVVCVRVCNAQPTVHHWLAGTLSFWYKSPAGPSITSQQWWVWVHFCVRQDF
jgi:hypothetical protein